MEDVWEIFSDYLFLATISFDLQIHAFVVMPNHIHLIVRDPKMKISEAMAGFMRESSKEIGRLAKRKERLWGSRFHSTLIGSPYYYLNAYKYVYRNPVRAGLCLSPFDYQFSTLPSLIGRARTILPIEADEALLENFESSVEWLERPPAAQVERAIGGGLRRRNFIPLRNESTKKPEELEKIPER
jgi:putative transposase